MDLFFPGMQMRKTKCVNSFQEILLRYIHTIQKSNIKMKNDNAKFKKNSATFIMSEL